MDEFKKHLRQHEHELDTEKPGTRVWEQVKLKTGRQPASILTMKTWLKYAAAACAMLMIVIGIKYTNTKSNSPGIITQQTAPLPVRPHDTILHAPVAAADTIVMERPVRQQPLPVAAPTKKPASPSPIIDELENSYGRLATYQLNRIRQTPVYAEEQGYFNSFKEQLRQMEKDEASVKKDIQQNGLSDILLDQLIEVYQQKLSVLKSFQTAIRKMNNRVQLQQRDSAAARHYYITL